ncbi:hypothetical protein BJ508DRAFT_45109 [Ascobolus immersus RN42]|uniref:IRG-type G domain-containing protein n=1 Tax=Ascobolus immersus RN42 TaxID=1160509 RepID=A0A3N4HIP3_ASCIM|nr:hypothetical protein BJ508DRAFT_45109 [Ascobolus immersus RN42]
MGQPHSVVMLVAGVVGAVVQLAKLFINPPNADNDTLQNIEEENHRRAEVERLHREAEEREQHAREAEERAKRAEQDAREREERYMRESKEREERDRQERERIQREMEEQRQRAEQEAKEREERAREERERIKKEMEEQRQRAEKEAKEKEERYRQEMEERQKREAEERQRLEQAAREREAEHRRQLEEQERENERQRILAEERRKKEEEEFQAQAELLRQQAEEQRKSAEIAKALAERTASEAKKFYDAAARGIRPIVVPTTEEVKAAKEKMQYDPAFCHFAICGPSGSGKSSLINAFRGLNSEEDAGYAKTDVVECTSTTARYPDPRSEVPFSRFVWYDIPGAGTLDIPDWQYFNDHGLFCFDFIILIYDGRFTSIAAAIIKNCKRFNIPVFVVRSKSDQHINNLYKVEDAKEENGNLTAEELYAKVKETYVVSTRKDFAKNISHLAASIKSEDDPSSAELAKLVEKTEQVYIVSSHNLLKMFGKPVKKKARREAVAAPELFVVDEEKLIKDLMKAAVDRRYGGAEAGAGDAKDEEDDGFSLVDMAKNLPKVDGFLEMLHNNITQARK